MAPVRGDDPGQEELGDRLDDPGAADAGDADARPMPSAKPGSSDHRSQPMTLKRGSSEIAVDPDTLHGARRGALPAADLGALEGGSGRARRGEQPVPVAQDDLGVRAHVHEESDGLGAGAAHRPG